jgi:hypothetical protein
LVETRKLIKIWLVETTDLIKTDQNMLGQTNKTDQMNIHQNRLDQNNKIYQKDS